MSEKSLIDAISHYQKDIERCPNNKERMLRCLKRLYVMPIKVEHLQATGVGRSVNNLRELSGDVGEAATALVAKWKAMVTAEDLDCEEDSSREEMLEDEVPVEKANNRVSPDIDSSVKDKENIRLNHRTDKIKLEKLEAIDKCEKSSKNSEKHSKDSQSSKHTSKDKEGSSKKDSSSSKNHSSSKDRKDKNKSLEKYKESSKSEHRSSSDKDKKRKEDKDKHHSRDKSNHSSKDKESVKEKDKHSSSSSKDKMSSSRDKNRSSDRSRDHNHKSVKKEKRSRSREREKESRKCEKRKHHDKEREYEKPVKKVKKEKESSDEEDSEQDSDVSLDRSSESDDREVHSSDEGDNTEDSDNHTSDLDQDSEPESYSKVKIKQEPLSDSSSDKERNKKKKCRSQRDSDSCSPEKARHSEEMKPPPSRKDLTALIKENEKKIKKEKHDHTPNEKVKKTKVKIEMNQDGSIDSGSGASFADALMGFDSAPSGSVKKKKKKEDKQKKEDMEGSSVVHSTTSTPPSWPQASHSGRSRSPSQVSSTSSYRSSASPSKQDKKSTFNHSSREAPEALLRKPVKLEPLSLDISSTLPEISTNYKPLPSIQSRHTPTQCMSEEQMFSIMTSKNQRTKVYSGYKYGQTLSVPSLYSLCIQVLYDNIDGLEYTGGVPYDILKPLLIKLNGEQLLNLEHYNPYLVDDTDDLWKFHCNKTFPKAARDDMETWRETYLRSMDERELKLKRLTANITESMAIKGPARQAKLAYVDSVAKPPRNIARKQAKYGTGSGSSAASTSGASISQVAAAQNQAKKKEIVSKAVVGGFTPSTPATEPVPAFNNPATAAKMLKKKKAPLMAKALQLIKGNRFKR